MGVAADILPLMEWLDWTLPTPAENLALDEALLDSAEARGGPETLRFWEPREHFVVLGYGKRAAEEVFLENCRQDGIPVLRRPSGGGTVLQGPGCLNYALILDMTARPELRSLTQANQGIMQRHSDALKTLVPSVEPRGITDLAIEDRKFMGNAQRRKKRFLLFHGTVLTAVRTELFEKYLRMPSDRPEYRNDRPHADFVTCLPASTDRIRQALQAAWGADKPASSPILQETVLSLVREKYSRADWNLKY